MEGDMNFLKNTESEMNSDPLSSLATWESMKTDIEVYQSIKKVVIDAFSSVIISFPEQRRYLVEEKIENLDKFGNLYSFEDMKGFFVSAKIYSSDLLSDLDDRNIQDYAAPFHIVAGLDLLVKMFDVCSTEEDVRKLGPKMVGGLYGLKERIRKTHWTKGWE